MNVWLRYLRLTAVALSLASCDQVIDTQAYLVGTFTGTYQPGSPEENYANNLYPPKQPATIESRLIRTTPTRYDFEGTVSLNGETYAMSGYEESEYGDLAYLKPQARPVIGNYLMNLKDETDVTYSICGAALYGWAKFYVSPEKPNASRSSIVTGTLASQEDCYYPESDTIVGTINELEKQ